MRDACKLFVDLWVLSQLADKSPKIDWLAADLEHCREALAASPDLSGLADPGNHDWTLLYRGNILDD